MAEIITLANGSRVIVASGGVCNRDVVPSTEVEVIGELSFVAEFSLSKENETGEGVSDYILLQDDEGYILVEQFTWYPARGYCWEEEWEDVARISAERAHDLLGQRVMSRVPLDDVILEAVARNEQGRSTPQRRV